MRQITEIENHLQERAFAMINELRSTAKEYLSLADQMESMWGSPPSNTSEKDGATLINTDRPVDRRMNRQKVHDYLAKHGVSSRSDIMAATEIPIGSIGSVLANGFKNLGHGLWDLRDEDRP